MKRITHAVARFVAAEDGTETMEWGLVCGLVVIGTVAAIALIGPKVKAQWEAINAAVP